VNVAAADPERLTRQSAIYSFDLLPQEEQLDGWKKNSYTVGSHPRVLPRCYASVSCAPILGRASPHA
jgi:hypothetical protein